MNKLTILFLSILTLSLISCNDDDNLFSKDESINNQDNSMLLYSKTSDPKLNDYTLKSHIQKIEQLNKNSKKSIKLIENLKHINYSKNELVFNEIRKVTLDNSDLVLFTIPLTDNENKKLIVYEFQNNYKFAYANLIQMNKLNYIELLDLDNKVLFSLQFNENDQIGKVGYGNGNINL